jgi:adenylate cyclase
MEVEEAGTLDLLKALRREIFAPVTNEFGGRIFKLTGDGALVEFASAVAAVRCAISIQNALRERNTPLSEDQRIELRIGISLGEVIVEGGDLYGNGVNVAARMEGLAEPGGICISGNVHEQVRGIADLALEDLGEQRVKNMARPVRCYRIRLDDPGDKGLAALPEWSQQPSGKPAVAVLPFVNMSGDPEQDYFADGMAEDIITALSRLHWLIVVARTSSFEFKGLNSDIREIARRLDVRYVLEGSVRKVGPRVRITGQLIDATTGAHLWADRFDGDFTDIFDLQDTITENVVGAIEPMLLSAEIERSRRERPDNLDAYDLYLRALPHFYASTREGSDKALEFLDKALALDPTFASANALAAWCHCNRVTHGWSTSTKDESERGTRLARAALETNTNDPTALANAGWTVANLARDIDAGVAAIGRAIELSPNNAYVLSLGGWIMTYVGDQKTAVSRCKLALRLSPSNPLAYRFLTGAARANVLMGQYEEAVSLGEDARRRYSRWGPTFATLAAAYAQLGRLDKAAEALSRLCELEPAARISHYRMRLPYQVDEQAERLWDGLRKAGLPE